MEPDQIIERIAAEDSSLTVEELTGAVTELTTAQDALRGSIKDWSGGTYAELSDLKAEFDVVTDALEKVSTALESAQAEIDAVKAQVGGDDDDTSDDETPADDEAVAAEVVPVAASATVRSTLARVRENMSKKEAPAVEVTNEVDNLTAVRSSYTLNGREKETRPSLREVGVAFEGAAKRFGGTKTVVASISTELAPERTLNGDASANERKMLDLFSANPVVPMTASGGCCSIPEPIYDQPLIGSLERPIRGAFDVLNASRGAVQAYPPVCMVDEGADYWTCEQDEAVTDDPETWKSCTTLDCDESEPTLVEPIFKCLTVGTFQAKFAPEQWEAFLFQVDKLAARKAEARLFRQLSEQSTSVYDGFSTGSTFANWIKSGIRVSEAMRQDQRLGVADAQLVWIGPEFLYAASTEDTITRRLNQVEEAEILKSKVDAILREYGITYVGSDDIAAMDPFSYSGSIPDYPDVAPTVILPAGSAKVLDGGEKNLGVDVPDLDSARRNEIAAFSEFWEGLLVRNCNVVHLNIPIQSCLTIPCPE